MTLETIAPLPSNMVKVMKALGSHYPGSNDGKEAGEMVKDIVSGKR